MPYLTLTENLKLQLSPGLVASYDISARKRSGSILGQTHTHLLTYLLAPDPYGAMCAKCDMYDEASDQCARRIQCQTEIITCYTAEFSSRKRKTHVI